MTRSGWSRIGIRSAIAVAISAMLIALAGAGTAWAAGAWSAPDPVDHRGGGDFGSYAAACPSLTLCFGLAGSAVGLNPGSSVIHVYDRGPAARSGGYSIDLNPAWTNPVELTVDALTCPTAHFCAAIVNYDLQDDDTDDDEYDVAVSADPASGGSGWHFITGQHPHPVALSCPSAQLCVAAGTDGLYVSAAPASDTWTPVSTTTGFVAVSCPTTAFCAAVDQTGAIWSSTDPAGGARAWTTSTVAAGTGLGPAAEAVEARNLAAEQNEQGTHAPLGFACSGPALCVAAPGSAQPAGTVLVSTDPTGTAAWTPVAISTARLSAFGCVPGGSCVAGAGAGGLITSPTASDPSELTVAADWTPVATTATGAINTVFCTAAVCVAAAQRGGPPLLAAPAANGHAWRWTAWRQSRSAALSSISCPAAGECVAADATSVYRSGDPTAATATWTHTTPRLDGPILESACWSPTLCLAAVGFGADAGDGASGDLERFNPEAGRVVFSAAVGSNDYAVNDEAVGYVSCAQGTCAMGSPAQGWFTSTDPANSRSWHQVRTPRFDLTCLKAGRDCLALTAAPSSDLGGGDLAIAARRSGPWRMLAIDPGQAIVGLACASRGACVVVDASGRMLVSTTPTAAASSWRLSARDPNGFNGVSCPSAGRCLAVDDDGAVVGGRP